MAEEDPFWRESMGAAQQGDSARYAALLSAALPRLRRAARAQWPGTDPATIEDAVQEALLALHAARHLYDPARPFLPFLFGVMRFRGADVMRRRRRAAAREGALDDLPETSAPLATNINHHKGLEAEALRAAIAALPARQRQAVELTKLRELSLQEASMHSGMTVAALKVATHRALLALRKRLSGG